MSIPAYMLIRQYAVDSAMRSPDGEVKIPSERELCNLFGVTRPTVRRALKDLIDDEFLVIRPGLGTFTNPQRAKDAINISQKVLSIGIIVGDAKHVDYGGFFGSLIQGIINYIVPSGGNFRIINIMHKGLKAAENISLLSVSGVIWINPPEDMLDIIDGLEQYGISVAVINRFPNQCESLIYIGVDYDYEGYTVAKQFIEHKHNNILIVYDDCLFSDKERLIGFRRAFDEAGVAFNENLLMNTGDDIGFQLNHIVEHELDTFDAVYVLKYDMLKLLDSFIVHKKKCDRDYMIIALEHVMRLRPDINCLIVEEPLEAVGKLAAETLSDKINGMISSKTKCRLKPIVAKNE